MTSQPTIPSQLNLPEGVEPSYDGIVLELAKRGAEVRMYTENEPLFARRQEPQPVRHLFQFEVIVVLPIYHGHHHRSEITVSGHGETPFDALIKALWMAYTQHYDRVEHYYPWWSR